MPVPEDWNTTCWWEPNGNNLAVGDPRGLCPCCRKLVTFTIQAKVILPRDVRLPTINTYWIHLILKCNSGSCLCTNYVLNSISPGLKVDRANDYFFMHPSRSIAPPHNAIPKYVADDWLEAQKSMEANAPKAAAVMCRRVLYGVMLDKKCPEHPLHDGLKQLISGQRLPAIFDDWLPAIKDAGHDGAHPSRALEVSEENIAETMEYTKELLRFVYIEPYEFQLRKARNTSTP